MEWGGWDVKGNEFGDHGDFMVELRIHGVEVPSSYAT